MPDRPVGFLNILKGPGQTSHGVVARMRRLLDEKRVGHAGTLDPAAIGVLPIAIGNATRLTMVSGWNQKLYWADIAFGAATTTDDAQGEVIEIGDPSAIRLSSILETLPAFVGVILQEPPIYSAVHVNGERSYHRARKGHVVALAPRTVRVDVIRAVGWRPPLLSLLVQCRSGTYIRALARDLGRRVGCPAHLETLARLRVGPFALRDAVTLEALTSAVQAETWRTLLWPADVAVEDLEAVIVGIEHEQDFVHGRAWTWGRTSTLESVRVYSRAGRFLGLAHEMDGSLRPTVVLEGSG